jgi:hypothetical protein
VSVVYYVGVESPTGEREPFLSEVIALQASRSYFNVGSAVITIPMHEDFLPNFRRNHRFILYRNSDGSGATRLGRTTWFLDRMLYQSEARQLVIYASDTLKILDQRIVSDPSNTNYSDKTQEQFYPVPAEATPEEIEAILDSFLADNRFLSGNMMNWFVREHFGDEVLDPNRDASRWIKIDEDKNIGVHIEKTASFQKILEVVTDIANMSRELGSHITFDMLTNEDGTFTFRVYDGNMGMDRSSSSANPLILSESEGNLSETELELDYSGAINAVYIGGPDEAGLGGSRLVVEVIDQESLRFDPLNRSEFFWDAGSEANESWMEIQGRGFIAGAKPKARVRAKVKETPNMIFGKDIDYGYLVSTEIKGFQFDCVVDGFSVNMLGGDESLELRLTGETPI